MAISYDEYTKRDVGQFDPEIAAYLLSKEKEKQENNMQTRHPLSRLLISHPWLYGVAGALAFFLGFNAAQTPKYHPVAQPATTYTAPSHAAPYIINLK